jgi:hypothetical protein
MSPDSPTCQISIRGAFDRRWSDYLGEMLLDMVVQEGQICITTFSGHPPDLSAFIGMLNLFNDQGVAVIACAYRQHDSLETEQTSEPLPAIGQQRP